MKSSELRHITIRLGLAFVFISIGIWEIVQPSYWSLYMPQFLAALGGASALTVIHGAVLLALGIAVLLGIYLRTAAALCALMMAAIVADVVLLFGFNDIVIRDVAILLMAVSLYLDDNNGMRLVG